MIFDIKEFAVFDGPGIRTTVFFKGCPLRCRWCHNPEGLSFQKELMVSANGCVGCGKCVEACPVGAALFGGRTGPERESCLQCGRCVTACGLRLRRLCGTEYKAEELATRLVKDSEFLTKNGGGVTFSGGEAMAQPLFLKEVLRLLPGMHKAVETSGYCDPQTFREIVDLLDYVIMDIKLADDMLHKEYTGVSNRVILENLSYLKRGGKPYVIRIPLIPGVSDTEDNLSRTARLLQGAKDLEAVELLMYHTAAGAKYPMVNREYRPGFDTERTAQAKTEIFQDAGIRCRVL